MSSFNGSVGGYKKSHVQRSQHCRLIALKNLAVSLAYLVQKSGAGGIVHLIFTDISSIVICIVLKEDLEQFKSSCPQMNTENIAHAELCLIESQVVSQKMADWTV